MNKIFYTVFIILSSGILNFASAQSCGSSGIYPCNSTNYPDSGGFEAPDSIPCVIQGEAYDTTIQLTMFTTFFAAGANQEVDSIQFLSIDNLPCGLCWATNNASDRFSSGEHGCIRISGTTNDPVGRYKLQIKLEAWINHISGGIVTYPFTVDQSGIRMFLRVQSSSGNCTPVDTSEAFAGDTATCVTSIAVLNDNAPGFSIFPNPSNGNTTVSFIAEKEARYAIKLNDVTGRLISTSEIEALPGTNNVVIEKRTRGPGVYFLSVTGGNSVITQKFSIVE
jgi:hypothetical protein